MKTVLYVRDGTEDCVIWSVRSIYKVNIPPILQVWNVDEQRVIIKEAKGGRRIGT